MTLRSRFPGRHRDGQPRTAVHRRLWDGPARAEAERLGREWPEWTILYGPGSRCFYALASWPLPEPLMLEDTTPGGLEARMREAETAMVTQGAGTALSIVTSVGTPGREPATVQGDAFSPLRDGTLASRDETPAIVWGETPTPVSPPLADRRGGSASPAPAAAPPYPAHPYRSAA
ncbi:hypothetical protein [Streptosporangium sp. NPDC051022]|uniref:hypothetical protein n=1 Tax=Streptosporangium sp. NPDC051022 TaxID=3155752 RepID=UPI00341EC3DB